MSAVIDEFSKGHECTPFVCPRRTEPYGLLPTLKQRANINAKYGEYFLRNIVKDTNPDIIHTSGYGSCLLGEFTKKKFDLPWIHHCRSLSDGIFLRTLSNADHIIFIGEWMKHTKLGKLRVPISTIYNPIPFKVPPSFSLDGRNGIVMVGDMSGRKGIDIGIRAWRGLNGHHNLEVFGEVNGTKEYDGLAYHGKVPQRTLLESMKRARLTFFPKRIPGWFDRTLLESQAVGTLALQSCGKQVHDPPVANAVRFPPTPSSLKNALKSGLSMNGDEYGELSKRAYKWVSENCTAERSAREIERIYDSLA